MNEQNKAVFYILCGTEQKIFLSIYAVHCR